MADPQVSEDTLFHNLLLFGRLLHVLGLEVYPGRMIEVQEALRHISIGQKTDFYFTLRACLVSQPEDLPIFDQAFGLFWRKPKEGSWNLELYEGSSLQPMEEPSAKNPVVLLPQQPEPDAEQSHVADDEGEEQELIVLTRTYSSQDRLRHIDFADLSMHELAAIREMIATLNWQAGMRKTRRSIPGRDRIVDMRRSLRRSLQHGGEILRWSYRTPKLKPRPVIIIADISGSMEHYTRILLHFMYGMVHGQARRIEVFLFGTQITYVSRELWAKDVDQALDHVATKVRDWSGGTRIGESLRELNVNWACRVLRGSPIVLVISDGWDRGDPELLNSEMSRLRRFSHRLIWLNPLLGNEQYEPLTRGMQAALPWIDDFLPVHNLASLQQLTNHLNRLDDRQLPRNHALSLQGAAFMGGNR